MWQDMASPIKRNKSQASVSGSFPVSSCARHAFNRIVAGGAELGLAAPADIVIGALVACRVDQEVIIAVKNEHADVTKAPRAPR